MEEKTIFNKFVWLSARGAEPILTPLCHLINGKCVHFTRAFDGSMHPPERNTSLEARYTQDREPVYVFDMSKETLEMLLNCIQFPNLKKIYATLNGFVTCRHDLWFYLNFSLKRDRDGDDSDEDQDGPPMKKQRKSVPKPTQEEEDMSEEAKHFKIKCQQLHEFLGYRRDADIIPHGRRSCLNQFVHTTLEGDPQILPHSPEDYTTYDQNGESVVTQYLLLDKKHHRWFIQSWTLLMQNHYTITIKPVEPATDLQHWPANRGQHLAPVLDPSRHCSVMIEFKYKRN